MSRLRFFNRVFETTESAGTGPVALLGAFSPAFRSFVGAGADGLTVEYLIDGVEEWEEGIGTVADGDPPLLTRSSVIDSSNGGSAVDFAAGVKNVRIALPAWVAQRLADRCLGEGTTGGTGAAYTLTLSPPATALVAGMLVIARIHAAATDPAPTLAVNGLTALPIVRPGGHALTPADLPADHAALLLFDAAASEWVLLNPAGPLTTRGDLLRQGAAAPERLPLGSVDSLLGSDGDDPVWKSVSGWLDGALSDVRGSILYRGDSAWLALGPGNAGQVLASGGSGADPSWVSGGLPRGYISGLELDPASGTLMQFGPGVARSHNNTADLVNASAFNKDVTAGFAEGAGNGSLDTGSIAPNTWYHAFIIGKADGTRDFLTSTSLSSPTMPSGFTARRWIGAFWINAGSLLRGFFQRGNRWTISQPTAFDFDGNSGTTDFLVACDVPPDLVVTARLWVRYTTGGTAIVSDPATTALTPNDVGFPGGNVGTAGFLGLRNRSQLDKETNTSQQVRIRSTANVNMTVLTEGWWIDRGSVL